MSLRENLLNSNPDDFRPVDKAIEIIVLLYTKGYLAFPEEAESTLVHSEEEYKKVGERIRFKIHKRGEPQDKSSGLELRFASTDIEAISGDKETLVLIGDSLDVIVEGSKLKPFHSFHGPIYKVLMDIDSQTATYFTEDDHNPYNY